MLIDAKGVAKVADFGLFRMQTDMQEEAGLKEKESSGHEGNAYATGSTQTNGSTLTKGGGGGARKKRLEQKKEVTGNTGSARYMAPEVFAHEPYDSKVDVFSFAIVAYEVLSRSRAYDHALLSPDQIPAAVHRTPTFRPKLPKGWLPEVVAFFESMWAASPADRPDFEQARCEPHPPPRGGFCRVFGTAAPPLTPTGPAPTCSPPPPRCVSGGRTAERVAPNCLRARRRGRGAARAGCEPIAGARGRVLRDPLTDWPQRPPRARS